MVENWVIELVDDVILIGKLVYIGEAADTKIVFFCQDFSVFADISLAFVALYLIGRVDDVLSKSEST